MTSDAPLTVTDARTHPFLSTNLAVRDMDVIAYLGVPIRSADGEAIGSLCAIDDEAHEWTKHDLEVLSDLSAILETELPLRREKAAMRLLAGELNHRVKNLFTVMGGMISMTARNSDTPADMAAALQGRLSALSWAHDLIKPAVDEGEPAEDTTINLDIFFSRLLEPHTSLSGSRAKIDLPDVPVGGRAVADMALVVHELATNAAKYGALSAEGGTVTVSGGMDGDVFVLEWEEIGGPELAGPPSQQGFGSKLIAMTLSSQLGGSIETDWMPTGLRHRLRCPASLFG